MDSVGKLNIDDVTHEVSASYCDIYAGRLNVEIEWGDNDAVISNLPCESAVGITDLRGRIIAISNLDRSIHGPDRPCLTLNEEFHWIESFSCQPMACSAEVISLDFKAVGCSDEHSTRVSLSGQIECEYIPVTAGDVLGSRRTLPIRFAKYYFPLLDLPGLDASPTMNELELLFGRPDHQGGGEHPQFGKIPRWIRYTLPQCYLRFEHDLETITRFTIMPLGDPPCDLKTAKMR